MFKQTLIALATVGIATAALAESPNIQPGMWENTSTVTLQSDQFSMPPRTDTTSDCVTEEDIAEGEAFLEDTEECDITNKDVRADGMNYSMTCASPDGGSMTMDAVMEFSGDSMSGNVDGTLESPMGVMNMTVEMSGKRTGDC